MSSLRTAIHAKSFPKPTGAGIVNLKMADGGMVPSASTLRSPQFYTPGSAGDPHASTTPMLSPLAPLGTITPESAASLPRPGASHTPTLFQPQQTAAPAPGAEPLKMQVGGQVPPTSLRGMFNSVVDTASRLTTSPAEKRANRAMAAPVAAPTPVAVAAPVPAPAPVQEVAAPMGNQSVLARREAAAGLRNGGPVGGRGQGDKVPAMLEPEEFVVSNDMMDDNPSLRGALHEMREQTLAKKGMTPAEADAKAVHFDGNQGEAYERTAVRQGGKGNGQGNAQGVAENVGQPGRSEALDERQVGHSGAARTVRAGDRVSGVHEPSLRGSVHLLNAGEVPGIDVLERPVTNAEWQQLNPPEVHAERVNPKISPNQPAYYGDGRFGAPEGGAPVGEPAPKLTPQARGAAAASSVKQAWRSPVVQGAVKVAGAVGALDEANSAINDYGRDNTAGAIDHGLASIGNVASTMAGRAGAAGMGYSLGHGLGTAYYNHLMPQDQKDAVGAGMNKLAQVFGGGVDDNALRQMNDPNYFKAGHVPSAPSGKPASVAPSAAPTDFKALNAASDAYNAAQEPSLRGPQVAPMDWASAKAQRDALTQKDIALGDQMEATRKGKEAEHAAYMESNDRYSQDLAAKVDREREKQAATTDSKSIDPRTAALGNAKLRELAHMDNTSLQQRGETLRATQNANAQAKIAAGNNAASLRGHQISADASMYGADVNARTARANALREGFYKDREFNANQTDKAFDRQQKGNEAFEKSLASQYPGVDGKGDPVAIGVHRQMASNHVNDLVQTLLKNGDKAGADALAQAGPGALDTSQHAKIRNATLRREAVMKANGWTPGSGNFKDSTHTKAWDPIGYEKRTVGGDHVLLPDGKHVSVNDLRNTPFYNPTGGTTDFDDFIREAQAAEAKRKGAK